MNAALKPTSDRKTKFWADQKNTFGALPGREGTCPNCTIKPGGCCHVPEGRKNPECYVYGLMSGFPGVKQVLTHNTDLLKQAKHDERVQLLKDEFARFRNTELKRKNPQLFYRIHWAGDVFNADYAQALTEAMQAFPDIHFWAYTRTLSIARKLADNNPNLTLYISLDRDNFKKGLRTYFNSLPRLKHDNLQICYMAPENDFQERYWEAEKRQTARMGINVPWPKTPPVLRTCPVDTGKLPLEYGCSKCQGCVSNRDGWKPQATWFQS